MTTYVTVWFLLVGFVADGEPVVLRAPMVSETQCVSAMEPYEIGVNGVYEVTCYAAEVSTGWARKVHGTAI